MVAGHLQIKKGKYYMVLELKSESGERKTKWISTGLSAKGNKRKAEAMLEEARANYQSTDASNGADILFADYMLSWVEIVRPNLEENTYAGYRGIIEKRIAPYFRSKKTTLGELKPIHIQEFYTFCQNTLHVSNNTVIHYHANLMSALKYATEMELISVTPMGKVKRPKLIQNTANFYTLEEAEHLISAVHGDPIEFPVIMAAYSKLLCTFGHSIQDLSRRGNGKHVNRTT